MAPMRSRATNALLDDGPALEGQGGVGPGLARAQDQLEPVRHQTPSHGVGVELRGPHPPPAQVQRVERPARGGLELLRAPGQEQREGGIAELRRFRHRGVGDAEVGQRRLEVRAAGERETDGLVLGQAVAEPRLRGGRLRRVGRVRARHESPPSPAPGRVPVGARSR